MKLILFNMSKVPVNPNPVSNPYYNHTFFRSRKLAWLALLGGTVSVGSSVFLGNTVFGRWMKFISEDARDGEAIVPSRKLRPLKDIAMSDLGLPETSKVKLFSTTSELCEVYGSINSHNGAFVGVPSYLNFEDEKELSFLEKLSSSVEEDRKDEIVGKYLHSFMLSKDAKLYIIAEGLALVSKPSHFMIPCLSSSLCFLASFLQAQIVVKYWFRGKSPSTKAVVYSLCAMIWSMVFLIISDRTNLYVFENAVGCLHSKYIDGGIEFYEKAVTRNHIRLSNFTGVSLENQYLATVVSDRLEILNKLKDRESRVS